MEELTIEEMTALRGGDKGGIPNKTDDALVDLQNEAIVLQINNIALGDSKFNIHIK
jgi:hypothetical protein